MVRIHSHRTDETKQLGGIWKEHPNGGSFLIARAGNDRATEYNRELRRPYKGKRRGVPERVQVEIGRKVAARCILLGWKDLENDDGSEWEYSEEKAMVIMVDPEFQDLALWVIQEADTIENYEREAQETDAKN